MFVIWTQLSISEAAHPTLNGACQSRWSDVQRHLYHLSQLLAAYAACDQERMRLRNRSDREGEIDRDGIDISAMTLLIEQRKNLGWMTGSEQPI